jgi:hypothetical protein
MVLPKHDERGPFFGKNEFVYDAEKDLYICPQGETLHRKGHDYKERSVRYAAKPSACNPCPLKTRCTKSKMGRSISGVALMRSTSKGCGATATPKPTARH